jgi:flagellar P-ring protein precursor FlgI
MITRLLLALILVLSAAYAQAAVRIKDIADIRGLRENQIVGYGLVIGLNGSGDTLRNAPLRSSPCSRCSTTWASM